MNRIVKSATQGVSLGVGVRVIAGERTGYAYSDDLSPEKIRHAAQVAALIAAGPAKVEKTAARRRAASAISIPCSPRPTRLRFDERVELAQRADRAARAYDPRVFQVQVTYADSLRASAGGNERRRSEFRSPAAGAHERDRARPRTATAFRSRATRAAAAAMSSIFS